MKFFLDSFTIKIVGVSYNCLEEKKKDNDDTVISMASARFTPRAQFR